MIYYGYQPFVIYDSLWSVPTLKHIVSATTGAARVGSLFVRCHEACEVFGVGDLLGSAAGDAGIEPPSTVG